MYTIVANNIGDAHEKVVRLILQGRNPNEIMNEVLTEDKEQTLEYPEPVNIHVTDPFAQPMMSRRVMFGELSMNAYRDEILKPRPLVDRPGLPDFSYLYSNLIWDYPTGGATLVKEWKADENAPINTTGKTKVIRAEWEKGNGKGDGIDQVKYVVNKLTAEPASRRCVVSLFNPYGHPQMDDPPCLNHIQFMIRNNELNMHALFRSNDMLSAWGGNAFALAWFQKEVLTRVNSATPGSPYKMGWLETTSISAHIYFKRDAHEADKFKGFY